MDSKLSITENDTIIETNHNVKSKYSPIIDAFLKGHHDLVEVKVPAYINSHNLHNQLYRIIRKRKIPTITVSCINQTVFLERKKRIS